MSNSQSEWVWLNTDSTAGRKYFSRLKAGMTTDTSGMSEFLSGLQRLVTRGSASRTIFFDKASSHGRS